MKAIVYEGIKDVKVNSVGDPEIKNSGDCIDYRLKQLSSFKAVPNLPLKLPPRQ